MDPAEISYFTIEPSVVTLVGVTSVFELTSTFFSATKYVFVVPARFVVSVVIPVAES